MTAGDLLTLEELTRLRRTSAPRGAALVLHAWATIAGAIALHVLWPSAVTLALMVVVVGSRQLGLVVLMHETAHWLLFPGPPAEHVGRHAGSVRPRWARISERTGAGITSTTGSPSCRRIRTWRSRPACRSHGGASRPR